MEIAVVGATAVVTLDAVSVTDARVAITALAPTIRRVFEAEAALTGTDGGGEAIAAAARAAAASSSPITDVRGSAEYRSAMAEVIARRAIVAALARARGQLVPIPASTTTYGDTAGSNT
jgi:carbon-monoxide dehydrogenase medium subunit